MERTLFDNPVTMSRPTSHRKDPLTSYEAAEKAEKSGKATGQRQAVLDAVKRWPGRTSAELADLMDVSRYMPARRLSELRDKGKIRQGEPKMCSICDYNCVTWYWDPKYPLLEQQ